MNSNTKIGWFGVRKEALPGVIIGMEKIGDDVADSPEKILDNGADLAIAFDLNSVPEWRSPKYVVVRDAAVASLLGWFHTYSAETFPISQYCRVATLQDWHLSRSIGRDDWSTNRLARWSSIVCGEMLGQSESNAAPRTTPLAWAHSCVSYAMARSALLYKAGPSEVYSITGSRILKCEEDRFFQKKRLSIDSLSDVWSFVESAPSAGPGLIESILQIVERRSVELSSFMRGNSSLLSTSAERRIAGFDEVIGYAIKLTEKGQEPPGVFGIALAAAAFFAGRGTSHIGLVQPYAKDHPDAYIWFGLFAGLAGPRNWDRDWLRLEKGVERMLAVSHSSFDTPQVDLSWIEYEWLSRISKSEDAYSSILRNNPRSLNVEIFPGVACQFRLVPSAHGISPKSDVILKNSTSSNNVFADQVLVEQLASVRELVAQLHKVLNIDEAIGNQPQLFKEMQPTTQTKKRPVRKPSKPAK